MGFRTEIRAALDTRLEAITNPFPIAWPNVDFDPKQNVTDDEIKYYEVFFRPGQPVETTLGGSFWLPGLYQINVHMPNNIGEERGLNEADKIAAHMPFNLRLFVASGRVKISSVPNVAGAIDGNNETLFPVVITWEYTSN